MTCTECVVPVRTSLSVSRVSAIASEVNRESAMMPVASGPELPAGRTTYRILVLWIAAGVQPEVMPSPLTSMSTRRRSGDTREMVSPDARTASVGVMSSTCTRAGVFASPRARRASEIRAPLMSSSALDAAMSTLNPAGAFACTRADPTVAMQQSSARALRRIDVSPVVVQRLLVRSR